MSHALKRFTDFICGSADEEEKEVFLYGLEAIVSTIECLGISFLVCCLVHQAVFGFFFILFLSLLKVHFTVYHCKTRLTCSLCYLGMMLLALWYYQEIAVYSLPILLLEYVMIIVHRKHELDKRTIGLMILYLAIFLVGNELMKLVLFQVITTLFILIEAKVILVQLEKRKSRQLNNADCS